MRTIYETLQPHFTKMAELRHFLALGKEEQDAIDLETVCGENLIDCMDAGAAIVGSGGVRSAAERIPWTASFDNGEGEHVSVSRTMSKANAVAFATPLLLEANAVSHLITILYAIRAVREWRFGFTIDEHTLLFNRIDNVYNHGWHTPYSYWYPAQIEHELVDAHSALNGAGCVLGPSPMHYI